MIEGTKVHILIEVFKVNETYELTSNSKWQKDCHFEDILIKLINGQIFFTIDMTLT